MISKITNEISICDYLDATAVFDPDVVKIQLCHPIVGADTHADFVLPLGDSVPNDLAIVRKTVDKLKEQILQCNVTNKRILLFCRAGLNRSPCVLAKALSELQRGDATVTFAEALEEIRRARPSIKPSTTMYQEARDC